MDSNLTAEEIMALMILKFEEHAQKSGGDGNTINTDQLYDFTIAEFPEICGTAKKDEILKEIISKMDANDDKRVTFEEFMSFSSSVAITMRDGLKE
ncbi:protein S100-A4-like [Lithobates pipiens]